MKNNELLKKYASLAVKVGVNVQPNQFVVINASVECKEFVRMLVKSSYEAKAGNVMVNWSDDIISKEYYLNVSDEVLKDVPDFVISRFQYYIDKGACFINVSAPTPGLMKDVDSKKLGIASKANQEKTAFFRNHTMSNGSQWLVVSYPTIAWARKVFPDTRSDEESYNSLLEAILEACRVGVDNNPNEDWQKHMDTLAKHNKLLNDYYFKNLHFKNSLGTNLVVELVEGHIWGGGGEYSQKGIYFSPNIPTEETFTMPHSQGVNGKVVATKPLNYQGKLVEDFYLVFKDGAVVEYGAQKEQETLKELLEMDEGSKRLGEVALISHDSPISNKNLLFYNTLFDENASCHLALGCAYTMNIKDSKTLSMEEMQKKGFNKSIVHVDFMFGSSDMKIVGKCYDGKEVVVFDKGNFVF